MNKTLRERLQFDPNVDFMRLVKAFRDQQFAIIPSPMQKHFSLAREKPADFRNHRSVLAVSIGGTNSKLMIASMKDGNVVVDYVKAFPNPLTPTPVDRFFDDVILGDELIVNYLKSSPEPCIGFSIPVPMPVEGVFAHISKVPGISGLIARDLKRDAPTHHFERNFCRYLESRNLRVPVLFYYSDTVVAHQGGMSVCPLEPGDKTILLVCGTGMATGDEGNFVLTCYAPILDTDEELYPKDVPKAISTSSALLEGVFLI